MKRAFCYFSSLILLAIYSITTLPAKEQALDVVLVLDTSGSMKSGDPQQLRTQAAKLFIQLLDRKDRVSIVSFSNRAYPVTQFLSLDKQKNERLLFRAIDKLASTGEYTNLHDALLRGYELLTTKSKKSAGKTIILMSDGKMDLGSESRNLRLLEKTLDDLTPKLANEKVKVHTIAFTNKSYIPLLKLMAEDTGGEFILLDSEQDTHLVFENLFERAKLPEMLPINEDSFIVDKAISEITIVASKLKSQSFISLESPDGTEINKGNYKANVNWFSAKKYDLITISNPAPGYWLVKYTEGGNKVYVASNINLIVESTKKVSEPGAPLHIEAYLTKNNRRLTHRSILNNINFSIKVTSPEAVEIQNIMVDDGSEIGSERKDGKYGISYAFELEGPYKIEVSAIGQTFDRVKSIFVTVKSSLPNKPFMKIYEEKIKKEIVESSKPTENDTSEKIIEELAQKSEKENIKEATIGTDDNPPETDKDKDKDKDKNIHSDDNHEIDIHEKDSEQHETLAIEENISVHEEETNYGFAIISFILFNILFASIGGAYYYYTKRKKGETKEDSEKTEKDLTDDSPEEKPSEPENSTAITESVTEDSSKALSSLSELNLDDELSSILESLDNEKK